MTRLQLPLAEAAPPHHITTLPYCGMGHGTRFNTIPAVVYMVQYIGITTYVPHTLSFSGWLEASRARFLLIALSRPQPPPTYQAHTVDNRWISLTCFIVIQLAYADRRDDER